jgi:hypothetical protein
VIVGSKITRKSSEECSNAVLGVPSTALPLKKGDLAMRVGILLWSAIKRSGAVIHMAGGVGQPRSHRQRWREAADG